MPTLTLISINTALIVLTVNTSITEIVVDSAATYTHQETTRQYLANERATIGRFNYALGTQNTLISIR